MEDVIAEYLDTKSLEGRSPNTIAGYRNTLRKFRVYLATVDVTDWSQVTKKHVRGFLTSEKQAGRAPTTLELYHATIAAFGTFLEAEGICEVSPAHGVKRPVAKIPETDIVTPEQMKALLRLESKTPFLTVRDRLILTLMYDAALRLNEVVTLEIPDVDLDNMTVSVLGKGSKRRVVPIGKATVVAFRKYFRARSVYGKKQRELPQVFVTHLGPMSRSGVWKMLKERASRIGISTHPHALRHSAVDALLESGASLLDASVLLGHSDIKLVASRYGAQGKHRRMVAAHRKHSPGDALSAQ